MKLNKCMVIVFLFILFLVFIGTIPIWAESIQIDFGIALSTGKAMEIGNYSAHTSMQNKYGVGYYRVAPCFGLDIDYTWADVEMQYVCNGNFSTHLGLGYDNGTLSVKPIIDIDTEYIDSDGYWQEVSCGFEMRLAYDNKVVKAEMLSKIEYSDIDCHIDENGSTTAWNVPSNTFRVCLGMKAKLLDFITFGATIDNYQYYECGATFNTISVRYGAYARIDLHIGDYVGMYGSYSHYCQHQTNAWRMDEFDMNRCLTWYSVGVTVGVDR